LRFGFIGKDETNHNIGGFIFFLLLVKRFAKHILAPAGDHTGVAQGIVNADFLQIDS